MLLPSTIYDIKYVLIHISIYVMFFLTTNYRKTNVSHSITNDSPHYNEITNRIYSYFTIFLITGHCT